MNYECRQFEVVDGRFPHLRHDITNRRWCWHNGHSSKIVFEHLTIAYAAVQYMKIVYRSRIRVSKYTKYNVRRDSISNPFEVDGLNGTNTWDAQSISFIFPIQFTTVIKYGKE